VKPVIASIGPASRSAGIVAAACLAAVAMAAGLTAGCAVGPDFHRPATQGTDAYTRGPLPAQTSAADAAAGAAQTLAAGADIPGQWWQAFHSDRLDRLVKEALRANPGVQAAQAALRQANELAAAQQGFFYPTVQGSFAASRQRNPVGTLAPSLNSGVPVFNLYTTQLSVGYAPDLFGANRRQVESLLAQAEYQRFELEATDITLCSNVVASAVQEAALRAQIAATERVLSIETEQLQIMQRELELGAIAESDVAAQEALLAQTAAQLPPLRKQLALQRDQLTALLGRPPAQEPDETFDLQDLQLPADVPVSLPSRLVEQRPDVRAAEAQLHAASANVGVAIAAMLPQISLIAGAGGTAVDLSSMFSPADRFWSVGANLSQTLFAGGTLYHRKKAAVEALDQAGAQYRMAVLTAFQNVADSLHALVFDADALKADVDAERAAERALNFARTANELGSTSYLTLLTAEQAYQLAVINRVQAQANRLADTAALFQALGGGWWNRSGEAPDRAKSADGPNLSGGSNGSAAAPPAR
jgi:NodT family efflux transporter outer membrane factor (OMF) lipoprotein